MSFNQTRDILDHAQSFHRRLACFYEELLDQAPEEQTCELLETLVEHEKVLHRRLKEYKEEASDNMLDTFFKYMPTTLEKYFSEYEIPDTVKSNDVIAAARHFDELQAKFYQEMAGAALSEPVREMLLNLVEMELQEQMTLSKHALELYVS